MNKMQQGVVIMAITFRLFLETESGAKKLTDCTEQEIKAFKESASKRLSNTLSQYYTQNPQEFERVATI